MGLFELSSWGEGGAKKKSGKKQSQKRKNSQDKVKGNTTKKKNNSKSKKRKFDLSIKNNSTNETSSEVPKKEKNLQNNKMKKKLQQNNLTINNSPIIGKKLKKHKHVLSSKVTRETLPIKKKSTFVGIKGPVLDKLGNVNNNNNNNKKQSMTIGNKKSKKSFKGEKNLQTEKLAENLQNKLTNSPISGKKGKKRKQFAAKTERLSFNSPKQMVLENVVKEKTMTQNGRKESKKRNRSELEGEKEEVIKSKRRRKSKKNKSNVLVVNKKMLGNSKGEQNQKINVNRLKGMLEDKEKEKKTRKWENSPHTLRERMIAQLRSSRFRFINETLYNNASFESKKYFKDDPEAFDAYHKGFQQQVDNWPLNPVDIIIESIKKMPKEYAIADFGCGEAKISESVPQSVHSFDFVAMNDKVTVCDMAHTPLLKSGVNVVVFCLSLMGTNLNDYLLEANRVLKKGGVMKIAEVESRFENIEDFIKLVTNFGFVNTWADLSNDLFYFLDFRKEKDIEKGKSKLPAIELKACVYKRR